MMCVDCGWCAPHFRYCDILAFHDGFVCFYVEPKIEVKLSDMCHHGFSSQPSKPTIIL